MANPIAGWYPDPSGDTTKLRWWDGNQWTDNYADAVIPQQQPAQPQMPQSQSQPQQAAQPQPQQAQPQQAPQGYSQQPQGYAQPQGLWSAGSSAARANVCAGSKPCIN